jgi:hypothetical protein
MDSLVVETAVGLLFVFAVFSALVSMLTEAVSRLIGLRGEYLLRGIRSLVDDGSAFKLPWGDLFRGRSSSPAPRSDESDTPPWSPSCSDNRSSLARATRERFPSTPAGR